MTDFYLIFLFAKMWGIYNLDVSENGGIPKSSFLIGFSIINHPFRGTLIFGNTHLLYVFSSEMGSFNEIGWGLGLEASSGDFAWELQTQGGLTLCQGNSGNPEKWGASWWNPGVSGMFSFSVWFWRVSVVFLKERVHTHHFTCRYLWIYIYSIYT